MGYSQRAGGANCQILIYGDSTALVGLDPAIIQAKTGLKTCNISEFRPVEEFVGVDFPLDQYLAHNRPPRYLLTSWTPLNFNLEDQRMITARPDGFLYALQYDRGEWLWKGMLSHGSAAISFIFWAESAVLHTAIKQVIHRRPTTIDEGALRDSQAGRWSFPQPPQQECLASDAPSLSGYNENARGVAAFRQKYGVHGTRVLIDVSPVANCGAGLAEAHRLVAGLTDNTLEVLPLGDFNNMNSHLDAVGLAYYSTEAANQILKLMSEDRASAKNDSAQETIAR